MKIKTRAVTKIFVAIFVQDHLELIMDYFNIWTFVNKEIDMKETI